MQSIDYMYRIKSLKTAGSPASVLFPEYPIICYNITKQGQVNMKLQMLKIENECSALQQQTYHKFKLNTISNFLFLKI
jgi:hypothetical protein